MSATGVLSSCGCSSVITSPTRSHARPGSEPDRTPTSGIPVRRPMRKRRVIVVVKPVVTRRLLVMPALGEVAGARNLPLNNRTIAHDRADSSVAASCERSEQPVKTGAVHYNRSAEVHELHNMQFGARWLGPKALFSSASRPSPWLRGPSPSRYWGLAPSRTGQTLREW